MSEEQLFKDTDTLVNVRSLHLDQRFPTSQSSTHCDPWAQSIDDDTGHR